MCSQQRIRSVGDQELALLHFIAEHAPATVAQAVEGFGQPRGLARSTVLTMMERLRRKAHLTRRSADGGYRYSPTTAPGAAVRTRSTLLHFRPPCRHRPGGPSSWRSCC